MGAEMPDEEEEREENIAGLAWPQASAA